MRNMLLCLVLLPAMWLGGCAEPIANIGIGAGVGAALSNTFAGAKADLVRREQELIARYNQGVEIGMEQRHLDEIEIAINDVRATKQTVETGESLLSVNWQDPKAVSSVIGLATLTVMGWFNRKKLKATTLELSGKNAAISKFQGVSSPEVAGQLHEIIKEKTNTS